MLISAEQLARRREEIAAAPQLQAIAAHVRAEVDRVLAHPLYVPAEKALLSRWGQSCRECQGELGFDPYSPQVQRCTGCGRNWDTEPSRRWWVYWYQQWLAERVWMLALHGGPGGDAAATTRAQETLAAIAARYRDWPNADNVLGPGRPFFSTYLESIWVLHLAAATALLREMDAVPAGLDRDLRGLFAESAGLIADFDEGRSNRQMWNAVALHALGRALGDAAMAERAATGPSGFVPLIATGFGADGAWYEGENYHWFALRGAAWGAELLRAGGRDLWHETSDAAAAFRAAFRAPLLTVLPDFTFPARRDARFGVTLRQRRMAELWELALAHEAPAHGRPDAPMIMASVLGHVYDPAFEPRDDMWMESTEVERAAPPAGLRRELLGWKALLWALPELPGAPPEAWRPGSVHLASAGLALVRRDDDTYVSLDYGAGGGGHGHPDRLNLTLVAGGVPWLLDFGTGSYVSPSLAWYRSTLAHNAPLLDGQSQAPAAGQAVAFEDRGDWAWACAMLPDGSAYDGATLQRTMVLGPGYLLDVVQMMSEAEERQLALPWHGLGRLATDEHGLVFTRDDGARLDVHLTARQPFQVLVRRAAGPPAVGGSEAPELDFPIALARGASVTLVACLDLGAGVAEVECVDDDFLVRFTDDSVHLHRPSDEGWTVEPERGDPVELGGLLDAPEGAPVAGLSGGALAVPGDRFVIGATMPAGPATPAPALTIARVAAAPALDGTLEGFPAAPQLLLEDAGQFRRAEEPWGGPEDLSARACLAHDGDTLYVAVDVTAPEPRFRPSGVPDPEWENENPDIHGDGLQFYLDAGGMLFGWLVVPSDDGDGLRVSGVAGTDGEAPMIERGHWQPMPTGYRVTFAVVVPDLGNEVGLDLYVNRGRAGRERRVGQLVWSGARGERLYLAGDRALPGPLPRVRLA